MTRIRQYRSRRTRGRNSHHVLVRYLDLIFSSDEATHEEFVRQVLQRLREAKLYANRGKCKFSTKRITFLGIAITLEGIAIELERIEAVKA